MPSIFSRKAKQPPPSDAYFASTFPQSHHPSVDEHGRILPSHGDGNGSMGGGVGDGSTNMTEVGRSRKQSKDKSGGRADRNGGGNGMGGSRYAEKQIDRERSMSRPSKVQFAPSTAYQYPDYSDLTTPTRATANATGTTSISSSQTARASPSGRPHPTPYPILKYPQTSNPGDQPSDERNSSEDRYTFLPTRFPLLARAPPEPYLETTLISSHGLRSGSRYRVHTSNSASNFSSISAAASGMGGRHLAPSGSWVGVIKEDSRNGGMRYGYLNVEVGLVVGLHEMIGAVEVCMKELTDRGLTTPRLFSSKALDLSSNRITLLIQSYIRTLSHTRTNRASAPGRDSPGRGGNTATATWKRDMQLASPNEIAWFLRWVLGRAVRIKLEKVDHGWEGAGATGGKDKRGVEEEQEWVEKEERGLMNWEDYEVWRGRERASEYDKTYFESFLRFIPPSLTYIIQPLFSLFSHFAAYSHDSGMTPGAISGLFGPLLFGCGPPSCSFDQAHAAFVRSAGATEHLILAYIRYQAATHDRLKGQFPGNLANWVRGYPRMLITDRELDLGLPRKGLRVLKVERARRMVRAYTPDLYRSGQTWAAEMLRERNETWPAWERTKISESNPGHRNPYLPDVTEDAAKNAPVLTDDHKKRLNIDGPVLPPRSTGSALSSSTMSSDTSIGTLSILTPQLEPSGSDFFASTIDRDWKTFEGKGFDDGGLVSEKLNFDLLRSVRQETLNAKRRTMTWDDFAAPAGGFNRNAGGLDATLTLSPPARTQIESWPEEREELHRKLRKSHKETQAKFQGWDTSPTVVPHGEGVDVIEEAFVDVAIDLFLSGGWTDYQELTHRPASWALMEYKARPSQPSHMDSLGGDPRISSKLFLFEEFVPESYQQDLRAPEPKRTKFFSRNRPKKSSHETPGVGRVTKSRDEAEFDAAIRRATDTRMVALSKPVSYISDAPPDRLSAGGLQDSPTKHRFSRKSGTAEPPKSPHVANAAANTSNKPSLMGRISGRQPRGRSNIAEERSMEETIETRTTSGESSVEGSHGRREPKPDVDKWIDILVASGAKRMDTQTTPTPAVKAKQPRVPLNRSTSATSMVKQVTPDFHVPLGQGLSPLQSPNDGSEAMPALRRYGSEKSSLRQPMFASSLALDKVSPSLERLGGDQVIEPSTPEAEHPEQYAYTYSPESSRAVPEMQAVRDRSQNIEKVLDEDAFHQPAGSIHSQSALEVLNAAGGDRSVHEALDSPQPQSSLGDSQPRVIPLEGVLSSGPAPPMLGAPIPISPRPLPAVPDKSPPPQHDEDDLDHVRAPSKRDTVHSIMDRYGAASPYGGHGRTNSEDLPPVPSLPLSGHAVLRQLRPGFMRPEVPSQYEDYGGRRDSSVSARDDAPAGLPYDRQNPGEGGGDHVPGLFARDEYKYEDSPVDPTYAPSSLASPILPRKPRGGTPEDDHIEGVGSARTQFGGAPWAALETSPGAPKKVVQTAPGPPAQVVPRPQPGASAGAYPELANFQSRGSPPRGTGRVGTLASKFESAGRVPPSPKRYDDGGDAEVSEYRTALEEPLTKYQHEAPDVALQPPAEHYHFEPPPTLADIEAIARRPSPGRVEHGMNLGFVPEEDEEYEEEDEEEEDKRVQDGTPLKARSYEDALGLRDTGAKEIGVVGAANSATNAGTGTWEVEKMATPDRKLRRR